ncbi:MAG: PorV/PorQ family protein [Elusimicrobia bacterium]|nr:PorV/PorQ family protein [Elusimicrobiota bacterium]
MKRMMGVVLILLSAGTLYSAGTTSGNTLIQSVGAQPQGMGESFSAIPADEGGVLVYHYNPASLAHLKGKEIAFTFRRGIAEDNFAIVSFGSPLRVGRGSVHLGVLAGTFLYYSVGTIDLIDSSGNSRSVNSQKDMAFIVSHGYRFGEMVSLGVNGKVLRSELLESFSATAFALDMGTLLTLREVALSFGVQNIGTDLKYNRSSEQIPLLFRTGLSYRAVWLKDHKTLVAMDLFRQRDEDPKANFGFEYLYLGSAVPQGGSVALRTGYRVGQDSGKLNFGLGLNLDRYRIDYSVQMMGGTGNNHFVSLGFSFGN